MIDLGLNFVFQISKVASLYMHGLLGIAFAVFDYVFPDSHYLNQYWLGWRTLTAVFIISTANIYRQNHGRSLIGRQSTMGNNANVAGSHPFWFCQLTNTHDNISCLCLFICLWWGFKRFLDVIVHFIYIHRELNYFNAHYLIYWILLPNSTAKRSFIWV